MKIIQNFCCSELLHGLEQIILNCNLNEVLSFFPIISKCFDNFNTGYKRENLFLNNRIISLSHHRLSLELCLMNSTKQCITYDKR